MTKENKKILYLQKMDGAGGVKYNGYNEWGQKINGWDSRDVPTLRKEAKKDGYRVVIVEKLPVLE